MFVASVRGMRVHVTTIALHRHPTSTAWRLLEELTDARGQAIVTAIIRGRGGAGRPVIAGPLQRIHATLRTALGSPSGAGDRLQPRRYVELISPNPLGRPGRLLPG